MNALSALPALPAARPTGDLPRLVPNPLLSQRAKAAIVVRLLINEGADIALEELSADLQAELTHQMGAIRVVDRVTLAAVVEEFTDALDSIGLSFPGGIAGALDALDGRIGRETAVRLRKEAGIRAAGDPWKRLRGLNASALHTLVEGESTEVAAVLLSKLDVSLAAELLGQMSGPEARRITYAISLTSDVTPAAVDRIGLALAAQLDAQREPVFATDAAARLGAILNSSSTPTRDDIMIGLEETDRALATAVRRAIFTFGNIPDRIAPADIPRVLRGVDAPVLLTALAGAEAAGFAIARDYVLENMSSRMADMLREEIQESGKIKPADCDDAMSRIVGVIRAMESGGDLVLIEEAEEDETA